MELNQMSRSPSDQNNNNQTLSLIGQEPAQQSERSSVTNSSSAYQIENNHNGEERRSRSSRSSDDTEALERKSRMKEILDVEENDNIPGFKITSTALIVLCLINIVIYIKLLTETLTVKDEKKRNSPLSEQYSQRNIALIFLLLGAIIMEMIGLVSILCRSRVLILIYGISMIVAVFCMVYLLEHKLGTLVITIANVIAIWRCYYLLTRHN